jgi:D-inositol-3-phosphate glycosyltransferase
MKMTQDEIAIDYATSVKRVRCMAFMDYPPGGQLEKVRKPQKGFLGWATRSEDRLIRKIRPEIQLSSHVRGNRVAVDYLMLAFLRHSQRAEFAFAVADSEKKGFEQWALDNPPQSSHHPVDIYGRAQLTGSGLDTIAPDIWLSLYGDPDAPLRMRDRVSSRLYPTATVLHGLSMHTSLYGTFLRTLLTPNYACDSLVCTSRSCKDALTNIFERISGSFNEQFGTKIAFDGRLDVIPLCVDTDHLKPGDKPSLRKKLGIPQDSLVLLFLGYISGVKADLTPLLPMIRKLVKENPRTKLLFVIAGTGPERYYDALLRVINEIGLAEDIILFREVSDAQKEDLFRAADIFVAPCESLQESFGLTPIEAMACGLPQVVADWNGYRDTVIEGRTGFLIPTRWSQCDGELRDTGDMLGWAYDHIVLGQSIALDVDTMYERLQILISHPELRRSMSEYSRVRAMAEFSYASVARRYDDLWTELVAAACSLQLRPKFRAFDEPAYFECFKHHATKELKDDCIVRIARNDALSITTLIELVQSMLPGTPVFEEALLGRLIEALSSAEDATKGVSVGELVSLASNKTRSRDTVMRHILFLLKHGKVTI